MSNSIQTTASITTYSPVFTSISSDWDRSFVAQYAPMSLPSFGDVVNGGQSASVNNLVANNNVENSVNQGIQNIDQQVSQQVRNLEPEYQSEWNALNANRNPALNYSQIADQIENIQNDSTLSDKDKKNKINDLRKKSGLSKKQFKHFFTKRFERIYKNAANQMRATQAQMKSNYDQIVQRYGANSAVAQSYKAQMDRANQSLNNKIQQFDSKASFYKKCFKSSFFGSLFGKLKSIVTAPLKIASKVLNLPGISQLTGFMKMIPGVGTMVSGVVSGVKNFGSLMKGDFKSFFGNLLKDTLPIPSGISNIFSSFSSSFSNVWSGITDQISSFKSNILNQFKLS